MDQYDVPYHTYTLPERMPPAIPAYVVGHGVRDFEVPQAHMSGLVMARQASRPTETKPRLAKEDVQILEEAFDANHKPTTQTKRVYAENMGVDLPRINNWFQNRRAKQKNLRRQEAFKKQNKENDPRESDPESSDEMDDETFFQTDDIVPVQHAATFPMARGPPPAVAPYNPQYANPASASYASLKRTLLAAQAAQFSAPAEMNHNFFETPTQADAFSVSPHDLSGSDGASFQAASSANFDHQPNYSYTLPSNHHYVPSQQSPVVEASAQPSYANAANNFMPNYAPEPASGMPQLVNARPSQLVLPLRQEQPPRSAGNDGANLTGENSSENVPMPAPTYEITITEDQTSALPSPILPRAPPSAGIASRRPKVHNKPAALGLDLTRGRPSMGPRTFSHADGFRRPSDSPMQSPRRRIVSAGGNRSGMSHRIYKSGVESAQRSPINLGSFPDAGAFFEHNAHSIRNPSILSPGNLAPPTPLSPNHRFMIGPGQDGDSVHSSPVEGVNFNSVDGNYMPSAVQNCPPSQIAGQDFNSPPVTPENALGLVMPPKQEWNSAAFQENDWYGVPDVPDMPIYTPLQDSFNLELQMPQPVSVHVLSQSQPVTPAALYQYPPNVYLNQDSSPLEGDSQLYSQSYPQQEYNFPEANSQFYAPQVAKQKTFQFSNSTPADFSEK